MTPTQPSPLTPPLLVLASSSPYRRELLGKLQLPFSHCSPDIDESAQTGESAQDLVLRLALEKARAVSEQYPNALIIASDQVAVLDDHIITKPHTHEVAIQQLQQASGRVVTFYTSLCLLNTADNSHQLELHPFKVHFLELEHEQIDAYLKKEEPYNCAGSFKSEGLGITLFSRMEGDDPNTLVGLPLIALCGMLRNEGVEPLSST